MPKTKGRVVRTGLLRAVGSGPDHAVHIDPVRAVLRQHWLKGKTAAQRYGIPLDDCPVCRACYVYDRRCVYSEGAGLGYEGAHARLRFNPHGVATMPKTKGRVVRTGLLRAVGSGPDHAVHIDPVRAVLRQHWLKGKTAAQRYGIPLDDCPICRACYVYDGRVVEGENLGVGIGVLAITCCSGECMSSMQTGPVARSRARGRA